MPQRSSAAKTVGRFLAILVSIGLWFETGCARIDGANTPAHAGRHAYTHAHELRFAVGADIQSLDPLVSSSLYEDYLTQLCMAYLTRADRHGNPAVPELATEVPSRQNGGVSQDGKTIIWHLRRGVRWSDGVPFSADDVVFTTKLILDPASTVGDTDGWNLITKIDEPDDATVVYHLRSPYASFSTKFFFGAGISILPEHLLRGVRDLKNAPYNALPVGIGPFRFRSWKRGDSVVMERNPYYFRGRAKLDRIIFKIIPDTGTMLAELRSHDLDLWIGVPPHFYPQARAIGGIATLATPSNAFDHLDFNVTSSRLGDVRVRRALRLALDRRELIDKVENGLYQLDESVVTPASTYHIDLPLVRTDVRAANALLDSAGWKRGADGIRAKAGVRMDLTFVQLAGHPEYESELELIRNAWKRIGVELTVKRYLASQLFAPPQDGGIVFSGTFDVARFTWTTTADEDISSIYACDRFPPAGQNDMRWCDRAVTEALARAKREYDVQARALDLAIVQRRLYDAVPTIVLDTREQLSAYNADLKNWHPNPVSPVFGGIMDVDI